MTQSAAQNKSKGGMRQATRLVIAVVGTWGMTACGDATDLPTSASPADPATGQVLTLEVSGPTTLLVGEKRPCTAVARFNSGGTPLVSLDSIWSSTRLDVVAVDELGIVNGRSAGQAIVTASYRGREATASISV